MPGPILQLNDLDTFKLSNSLLKESYNKNPFGKSFEDVLENKVKEVSSKVN